METLEKKGKGSALLPFLLFIVIYLGAGLYFQAQGVEMAFYQFPSVTAMFIALLLAFCRARAPSIRNSQSSPRAPPTRTS